MNIRCFMINFDLGPEGGAPTFRHADGRILDPAPPGAMFWMDYKISCPFLLDRVPCRHLFVVAPSGTLWPIDSKGCADPSPHICWSRHGDPPSITVDKRGSGCRGKAGKGSFSDGKCHVFLWDGEFIDLDRVDPEYFYALNRGHRARLIETLPGQMFYSLDPPTK